MVYLYSTIKMMHGPIHIITSAITAALKNTRALMAETEQVCETSNFSSTPVCRC